MREVRKGSRRGRLGGVGRKARARQPAALETMVYIYYLASAPARCGPLAAVGAITRRPSQPQTASERSKLQSRMPPRPSVAPAQASSDHHVDERLGICAKASTLLNGEGNEAVVGITSENEVTVLTDLACSGLSSSSSVDNRSIVHMRLCTSPWLS